MSNLNPTPATPEPNQPGLNLAPGPSEHALFGKIARLPADIREQINQRLFEGQTGPPILPWLNDLPPVKEILAAQFNGVAISPANLTHWRQTDYHRWFRQKETKELCLHATGLNQAGDGTLAPAAAAAAAVSGKILQFLDAADPEKTGPDDLVKCALAACRLHKGEQNVELLKLARQKVRQRDEYLIITRDRDQRDDVQIALRVLGDVRAKQIEACGATNLEKMEMMGRHLFGKLWISRPVPENYPPGFDTNAPLK